METLYRELAEDIKTLEQYNQSMDSASWGYEEGILITGNQAKAILEHAAQLKADKEELLQWLGRKKDYVQILRIIIDNPANSLSKSSIDLIGTLIRDLEKPIKQRNEKE